MSVYLEIFGHRVFVEHARWAAPCAVWECRRENGETVIWLGRLHLIHTPPRWSAAAVRRADGAVADDRGAPS